MPGVPPDAVDNVKRLLKGIFRRGKNKKQDKPTTEQPPQTQPVTSPQYQTSPTNGTAPAVDKPLPPTHPLATGQHDVPQEAVPQDHAAQPGPELSTQDAKKADGQSAPPAVALAEGSQEPAPATEKENPPAPPPKNDSAFDTPKAIDTSENKENVPATSNAPLSDSALATPNTPAKPNYAAEESKLEPGNNTAAVETQQVEEKVPVHVEPLAPKTNLTASGMSATSGPLEDFPAGMASDKD